MVKVAMVTSWMVRCGIFTYTQNLAHALADLDVESYIVRVPRFGAKTPEIMQNVADSIPIDKIDLIHVQHEYGLYQGLEGGFYGTLKRLGKPIITTMHAIGVRWDIDRVIASTSKRIIVHNEFCARRLGFPTIVIPHGTKPCEATPTEEAKRSLGIDPRAQIVGYCGFISEYKGLETLFEAATKIPKIALLIGGGWFAGPGTTYSIDLKQKSLAALPGRCQWLGYVADEKLSTVYGAMDLVVYPSRFATESGALLMALSHGKAVLASDIPPFKEKEKLGVLMTFKNMENLRQKIKRLLRDKELRTRLEEGAKQYAKAVQWSEIAKKHHSLYEETLKSLEK